MANLYSYKEKRLNQFLTNELLIKIKLEKYGIVYDKTEFFNLDTFVIDTFYKYDFVRYDIKQLDGAIMKNDPHSHDGDEARMVLRGEGRFYFDLEDRQLQLDVVAGDFVVIPANLIHYFKTNGCITVIRFFSDFE